MGCTGASGCGCGCAKSPEGTRPETTAEAGGEPVGAPASSSPYAGTMRPDGSKPGPGAGGAQATSLASAKGPYGGGGGVLTAYVACNCVCHCVYVGPTLLNATGIYARDDFNGLSIAEGIVRNEVTQLPGNDAWDWGNRNVIGPTIGEGPGGDAGGVQGVPGYTFIGDLRRKGPDELAGPTPDFPLPGPVLSLYPVLGSGMGGTYASRRADEERVARPPDAEGHPAKWTSGGDVRGLEPPADVPGIAPPALGQDGGPERLGTLASWVDEGTGPAEQVGPQRWAVTPDDVFLGVQEPRPAPFRAIVAPLYSGDFERSGDGGSGAGIGSEGADPEVDNARSAVVVAEEAPEALEATEDGFDPDLDQDDGRPDHQTATSPAPGPERTPETPPQVERPGGTGALPALGQPRAPLTVAAPRGPVGGSGGSFRPSLVAKPSARPSIGFAKGKTNAAFAAAVAAGVRSKMAEFDLPFRQEEDGRAEKRHSRDPDDDEKRKEHERTTAARWAATDEITTAWEEMQDRGTEAFVQARDAGANVDKAIVRDIDRQVARQVDRLGKLSAGSGDVWSARKAQLAGISARESRDRATSLSARVAGVQQSDRARRADAAARHAQGHAWDLGRALATATDPVARVVLAARLKDAREAAKKAAEAARFNHSSEGHKAFKERKAQAKAAVKAAKKEAKKARMAARRAKNAARYGPKSLAEETAKEAERQAATARKAAEDAAKAVDKLLHPEEPPVAPAGGGDAGGDGGGDGGDGGGPCTCKPPCSAYYTCVCECLPPGDGGGGNKGRLQAFSTNLVAPAGSGVQGYMAVPAAFQQQAPPAQPQAPSEEAPASPPSQEPIPPADRSKAFAVPQGDIGYLIVDPTDLHFRETLLAVFNKLGGIKDPFAISLFYTLSSLDGSPRQAPPGLSENDARRLAISDPEAWAKSHGRGDNPGFTPSLRRAYSELSDGRVVWSVESKLYHKWIRVYIANGDTHFRGIMHGVTGDKNDTRQGVFALGGVFPSTYEHERVRAAAEAASLDTFRGIRDQLARMQSTGRELPMSTEFRENFGTFDKPLIEWGHYERFKYANELSKWQLRGDRRALTEIVNEVTTMFRTGSLAFRDLRWLRIYELNPSYPSVAELGYSFAQPRPGSREAFEGRWSRAASTTGSAENLEGVDTESLPGIASLLAYRGDATRYMDSLQRAALIQLIRTWRAIAQRGR